MSRMKHANPSEVEGLHGLDDPHLYLETLIDRLFVQKVADANDDLAKRLDVTKEALDVLSLQTTDRFERVQDALKKVEQAKDAGDRSNKIVSDLRVTLKVLHEQGKATADEVTEVLRLMQEAEAADRERDEATHEAVTGVLERVDTLGEAEVGRDKLASKVAEAVHEDVARVKVALEADVRTSLGTISQAVEALAAEEARRSQATGEELKRLRRWTLAATLTASAALIAAVLAVIL